MVPHSHSPWMLPSPTKTHLHHLLLPHPHYEVTHASLDIFISESRVDNPHLCSHIRDILPSWLCNVPFWLMSPLKNLSDSLLLFHAHSPASLISLLISFPLLEIFLDLFYTHTALGFPIAKEDANLARYQLILTSTSPSTQTPGDLLIPLSTPGLTSLRGLFRIILSLSSIFRFSENDFIFWLLILSMSILSILTFAVPWSTSWDGVGLPVFVRNEFVKNWNLQELQDMVLCFQTFQTS